MRLRNVHMLRFRTGFIIIGVAATAASGIVGLGYMVGELYKRWPAGTRIGVSAAAVVLMAYGLGKVFEPDKP